LGRKAKTTLTLMEMNDVSRIYLTEDIVEITGFMTSMDKFFYIHPIMDDLWKDLGRAIYCLFTDRLCRI
jgi:enamine deaminase RidA (YjgF/YER057c/UK114 family)